MFITDELWRLVAFISKLLSDTEHNYKIHDKKILAIVRCLKVWRHFLEGAMVKFEIWTNHQNLGYYMKVLWQLSLDDLITLQVQVNKENSIESLFISCILLIQLLYGLCTIFLHSSCDLIMWHDTMTSIHVTVTLSHTYYV